MTYNNLILHYFLGKGANVWGEVYKVDTTILKMLDILEDHPNFYVRELYDVAPINNPEVVQKVSIYVIKNFNNDLLNQPLLANYSTFGSHNRKYIERHLRDSNYDYKFEILSSFQK